MSKPCAHVDEVREVTPKTPDGGEECLATGSDWVHLRLCLSRGLSTSPVPYDDLTFETDFDFVDHRLVVRTSDGRQEALPLEPQTVAQFYRRYLDTLRSLGVPAQIPHPKPNEVLNPVRFDAD